MQLLVSHNVAPAWLEEGEEVWLFVPEMARYDGTGEVLAEFCDETERLPAVVRQGSKIILTFSPHALLSHHLEERYTTPRKPLTSLLPFDYNKVPGPLRALAAKIIFLPNRFTRASRYPRWPRENCVDALRAVILNSMALASVGNLPALEPWPNKKRYAVCLTHDVDSLNGLKKVMEFNALEEKYGVKACYYVVSCEYALDFSILDRLAAAGCEIGSHGYKHDNKIAFLDDRQMTFQLEQCYGALAPRYAAYGFRSPSLLRTKKLLSHIPKYFHYDSSLCDTDLELYAGCCTVFPFFAGDRLELPITLPMDASLAYIGYSPKEILQAWVSKLEWIKKVGGLAMHVTHCEPHLSGNREMLKIYEEFLRIVSSDPDAWIALPHEVATWWRGFANGGS